MKTKKLIGFKLDERLSAGLDELAYEQRCTVSVLVRRAIRQAYGDDLYRLTGLR